jgi:hypothetical protein
MKTGVDRDFETGGTMTIEELRERLKGLNNPVTATFGYLDMIQDPPPEMQIDKEAVLVKAHKSAERASRLLMQLIRDSWESRTLSPYRDSEMKTGVGGDFETGGTMLTMHDVSVRCNQMRGEITGAQCYLDAGQLDKGKDHLSKADEMVLKLIKDAI